MGPIGTTGFTRGWHEARPMADYLGDPAVSASLLWELHSSTPAHVLEYMKKAGTDTTDAKALGTMLHARVYEPANFDSYVVLGQCEAKKRDGQRCTNPGSVYRDGQSFCGVKGHDPYGSDEPMAPGIIPIPAGERAKVLAMTKALEAHYTVSQLLAAPGPREVVGVIQDRETGLWLRIRPDQLIATPPGTPERWHWSVVNLKSTGKVARGEPWRRDFENAGHPFKAAFYRMVIRELWPVEPQHFLYPTVETYPPFAVILHRLHEDWLDIAEVEVRQALQQLASCVDSGTWPAYGLEVHDINLPEWRLRRIRSLDALEFEEVSA